MPQRPYVLAWRNLLHKKVTAVYAPDHQWLWQISQPGMNSDAAAQIIV
jgi:hypothetical protein